MSDELRLIGAFSLALLLALTLTPLARRVAVQTAFLDRPARYKKHAQPTPYLGGIAVIGATAIAMGIFADGLSRFQISLACALMLLAVGTVDDRVGLGILPRLCVQLVAVVVLWTNGVAWHVLGNATADFGVTLIWVVGLINAFNLMDNLDGAAGTVAAISAAGIAAVALIGGDAVLAAAALALAGACAGFLPFNLARPSRIFIGDGGSMPVGLLLASWVMLLPDGNLGWSALLASAPLVGLAIFDTTLVVVSRHKRGAPVFSGGRDHLTHRLLGRLGTPLRVALVLAAVQGGLCAAAIALFQLDRRTVAAAAAVGYLALGAAALAALEGPVLVASEPERPA